MQAQTSEVEYGIEYRNYLIERGWFRRIIRKLYLFNIRSYTTEKVLDFGCGVGGLLQILPKGSVGLEINNHVVEYCRARGLDVRCYYPEEDAYQLRQFRAGQFSTLTMCHVLEHLEKPAQVLRALLKSCARLGIEKVVIVVPGRRGFRADSTHRTFIDDRFLRDNNLDKTPEFTLHAVKYFPFNLRKMGDYFTHNETLLVYQARQLGTGRS